MIVREEFDPVALVENGTAIAACDWLGCVEFGGMRSWLRCPLEGDGKRGVGRAVDVDDLENRMSCSA